MQDHQLNASIIIIGAGAIVRTAHLPAYRLAGYRVKGIFDLQTQKAASLAREFDIQHVYTHLDEAFSDGGPNVVFDLAVPASEMIPLLKRIPVGSTVLLQKPMGEDLSAANEILGICTEKKLMAGVNFQLRYAPYILKARDLIANDLIGPITDIEVKINAYTPWHLWDFLADIPRMEILYHSIHYIDLVRSFLGNPVSVIGRTIKHPSMSRLASVRTNISMNYGEYLWANILTNHCHDYGSRHQQSYLKIEGTKGAIFIRIGLLLNYPVGEPDVFEYVSFDKSKPSDWQQLPIDGSWFPHAFIGPMAEMMQTFTDRHYIPSNHVIDCLYTMACVEAAYISSDISGVQMDSLLK